MNRPLRSLVSLALSAFLLCLLLPADGSAQLRLLPQVGLYAPVSDVGTVGTGDGARTIGSRESSFAYGLAAELGSADGTNFRLTVLYGTDGEVPGADIGCTGATCEARSTVINLTGSFILRPLPRIVLVQPYLVAGGGLKRYDYDFEGDTSLRDTLGDDANKLTGQLGVGADWTLGILNGTVEISDFVSGAILEDGGDTQHDFFLTIGVYLG